MSVSLWFLMLFCSQSFRVWKLWSTLNTTCAFFDRLKAWCPRWNRGFQLSSGTLYFIPIIRIIFRDSHSLHGKSLQLYWNIITFLYPRRKRAAFRLLHGLTMPGPKQIRALELKIDGNWSSEDAVQLLTPDFVGRVLLHGFTGLEPTMKVKGHKHPKYVRTYKHTRVLTPACTGSYH